MAFWESLQQGSKQGGSFFAGILGDKPVQNGGGPAAVAGNRQPAPGYGQTPAQGYGQGPMPGAMSPTAMTRPPVGANAPDSFYGLFNKIFSPEDVKVDGRQPQTQPQMQPPMQTQTQPQAYPMTPRGTGDRLAAQRGLSREGELKHSQSAAKLAEHGYGSRPRNAYVGDSEDLLDQHVAYNLRQNPEAAKQIQVTRKRPGVYDVNGKEIDVEWQYSEQPGAAGHLVAIDGPTRMPFFEYIKRPDVLGQQSAAPAPYGGYGPTRPTAAAPAPQSQPAQAPALRHDPRGSPVASSESRSRNVPPEQFLQSQPSGANVRQEQFRQSPSSASNASQGYAAETDVSRKYPPINNGFSIPAASSTHVAANGGSGGEYKADKDDLLDQHVAYFCKHHPQVYRNVRLARKRPGIYDVSGREVQVEWQYATTPGGRGQLIVIDGPLRQPFSDYMMRNEANAEYTADGLGRNLLHQIPQERRLTFGDQQSVYSRLDAMKVAKAQAQFREKAADYVQQGQDVPADLMKKYEKSLQQKLGNKNQKNRMRPPQNPGQPSTAAPMGNGVAQGALPPALPGTAAMRGRSPMQQGQPGFNSPRGINGQHGGAMTAPDPRGRSPQPPMTNVGAMQPTGPAMWTPPNVDFPAGQTPTAMTRGISGQVAQPVYGVPGYPAAQPLPVFAPGTGNIGVAPVATGGMGAAVFY